MKFICVIENDGLVVNTFKPNKMLEAKIFRKRIFVVLLLICGAIPFLVFPLKNQYHSYVSNAF